MLNNSLNVPMCERVSHLQVVIQVEPLRHIQVPVETSFVHDCSEIQDCSFLCGLHKFSPTYGKAMVNIVHPCSLLGSFTGQKTKVDNCNVCWVALIYCQQEYYHYI